MTRISCYPSDLTDNQFALIEPLLPPSRVGPLGGRPEIHSQKDIVNAIFYVMRTGCSLRQLPSDFPPWESVYRYFKKWRESGTIESIHNHLRDMVRLTTDRQMSPTAAIIDAQSIKGADTVGASTRGYDAGKKTNGRKRHVIVDTAGLLLMVVITAANVQDRDGAREVTEKLHKAYPKSNLGRWRICRQVRHLG